MLATADLVYPLVSCAARAPEQSRAQSRAHRLGRSASLMAQLKEVGMPVNHPPAPAFPAE